MAMSSEKLIQLGLLGGFRIDTLSGLPVPISGRKGPALLAYLALAPGMTASRDKLADLLWGDRDSGHARNSLRQLLSVLRREFAAARLDVLETGNETVALRNVAAVDVKSFREGAASAQHADLVSAAAAYAGAFLDGLFSGAEVFESWAESQRNALASEAVTLLDRLARTSSGDAALRFARRLVDLDPVREASHRLLMRILAARGERDKAIRQYLECTDILKRELGATPSPETVMLYTSLTPAPATPAPVSSESANLRWLLGTRTRIALLPFALSSDDSEVKDLGELLGESISTRLSQESEVVIIQRTSRFCFPSGLMDLQRLATELKAHYILRGSLRHAGHGIRIFVQLVDAISEDLVWAETYDTRGLDASAELLRIAEAVASAACSESLLRDWSGPDPAPKGDPRAWALAGRGLVKVHQQTKSSIAEAIGLSRKAMAFDRENPRVLRVASAAISSAVAQLVLPASSENLDKALRYARAAVDISPRDEQARFAHSWASINAGRFEEAFRHSLTAADLNPSYSVGLSELGERYASLGRHDDAVATLRRALDLSPRDPANFWRHHFLAVAHLAEGEDAHALSEARAVACLRPDFLRNVLVWAAAAASLGDAEEAERAVRHCHTLAPGLRVSSISPGVLSRFVKNQHHQKLLTMLRKAGLPA